MDARFSISNMSTEWGPLVAWFPVDEVTIRYLRRDAPTPDRNKALNVSRKTTSSDGSTLRRVPIRMRVTQRRIVLDLNQVTPHVSGPDTVQAMQSLAVMEENPVAIQKAYLVSCVNSRIEDLETAAWILCGKKVAPGVKLYVGAASAWTQQEAERRGVWQALLDAGAIPLPPSCGPCIGLGAGLLEKGEVGISATNRNFKGRMGSRDAQCYLASPEVVAASAIAGYITGSRRFFRSHPGAQLRRVCYERTLQRAHGSSAWLPRTRAGSTGVHAARQRQHRRHLR